jgi:hypothetical protein
LRESKNTAVTVFFYAQIETQKEKPIEALEEHDKEER